MRRAGPTPAVVGLVVSVALVAAAVVVPRLAGWDVRARSDAFGVPPLHGLWSPGVGPGTLPAFVLAACSVAWGWPLAQRLSWRGLLLSSYAAALGWLVALALVDGRPGLERVMENPTEYLLTARRVDDLGALLIGYVERIPLDAEGNWPIHVAGHPPGALLFFVLLVRVGLGGDLTAALAVCALAASVPAAVLATLDRLGARDTGRRVAPYLVLTPAAVFLAVSADGVFTALAAWGLAALAAAASATTRAGLAGWGVASGLLLGWCVMSSYGLPLLGLLALAVLAAARSWWPLPVSGAAALAVVLAFAGGGFAWWEAYPVLVDRYWDGLAADRPAAYWLWGNLAALLVSAGPLVGAGVGVLLGSVLPGPRRAAWTRDRVVLLLAGAALASVVVADLSQMSKAEVERIWLPFMPWLTLSLALLPDPWRRPGLALQVTTALVVQHLLYTTW